MTSTTAATSVRSSASTARRAQQRSVDRRARRQRLPDAPGLHAWSGAAGCPACRRPTTRCASRCRRETAQSRSSRWSGTSSCSTTPRPRRAASPSARPSTDKSQGQALSCASATSIAPAIVPADQWEFVDARTIRLLPEGTPFRIGAIYQLVYKAANPPVSGIGFAATRDLISFLRYARADDAGTPNPLAAGGRPAITPRAGARQLAERALSARLRLFGLQRGRVEPHRVRRHRLRTSPPARIYAQLSLRPAQPDRPDRPRLHASIPGATFPFAYETQTDPFTGKRDGTVRALHGARQLPEAHPHRQQHRILARRAVARSPPTHSASTTARRPTTCASITFAGTQHGGIAGSPGMQGVCAMPAQPHRLPAVPARRARQSRPLGEGWHAAAGEPLSAHRRRHAGGESHARGNPRLHAGEGAEPAPAHRLRARLRARASSARCCRSCCRTSYRVLVPKVDPDGNEVAGLRLPDITVPTGTATGWNVRAPRRGRRRRALLPAGLASSPSPRPRPSARRRTIRARRSRSATRTAPTMPSACGRPPPRWSTTATSCRRTRRASSAARRRSLGSATGPRAA